MATTSDNRAELMFLGKECQHPACHLHDFLPFDCPACKATFCQPHFLPSQHQCQAPLPPSMVDRIAPTCPMCNEVVPTTNGGPNEAVERHILAGVCPSFEGGEQRRKAELRRKKERGEVCFRKGCVKALIVPMKCESCTHLFCPTHRHPTTHTCSPSATPSGSASGSRTGTPQPTSKPLAARLVPTKASSTSPNRQSPSPAAAVAPASSSPAVPISAKLDARAAAAAAAMKRAGQDAKAPFVKTKVEKRATAESSSQIQALKARHDKGLLSKAEELKYAELVGKTEGSRRKGEKGGKDKDCVIA